MPTRRRSCKSHQLSHTPLSNRPPLLSTALLLSLTCLALARGVPFSYFIVLQGSVQIEERQVHHQEGAKGDAETQMRITHCHAGKGFHHFPLVMQYRFYGYSARVTDPMGASIILVSKTDYVHALRRTVEKEMTDTVNMLKATPFFSSWSDTSISRLYFWFTRRRFPPEEDVVRQGDDADFCFIIRSGRCDVLVQINENEEPEARDSPNSGCRVSTRE